MKNTSGYEVLDTIDLVSMVRKPVDCFYLGSELIKSPKITKGEAMVHTFAALHDDTIKFTCWGFGLIDSLLCGNPEKEREGIKTGTPIRITYKGKRPVTLENGTKFNAHDVSVYDISEEFESKKITTTKLEEFVWA